MTGVQTCALPIFLQLSWVIGAAVGVLLPVSHTGWLGYFVAGVVGVAVTVLVVGRYRLLMRTRRRETGTARPVA